MSNGTAGRWLPLVLAAGALIALAIALIERGTASLVAIGFFVVLLPAAIAAALLRWWPRARHTEVQRQAINWHRKVNLIGAALIVAAAVTLLVGVALAGGRLGTILLVAGAFMLPPAALVVLAGLLLRREARAPEERILYEASVHWGVFAPAIATLTAGVALAAGPFGAIGFGAALVLYLIVLPGTAAQAIGVFVNTELMLTEDGVVAAYGLLRKRTARLPRSDVQAVGVYQNWLGRQLGYGKISLVTRDGRSFVLPGIADPEAARSALS